jgi:hypothetical protein
MATCYSCKPLKIKNQFHKKTMLFAALVCILNILYAQWLPSVYFNGSRLSLRIGNYKPAFEYWGNV